MRPVTNYGLDHCQRLRAEYEARRGKPGFDEQRLADIVSACARRRTLRDKTGLTPEQVRGLPEVIENERAERLQGAGHLSQPQRSAVHQRIRRAPHQMVESKAWYPELGGWPDFVFA